jgi:hypothetical protein
MTHLIALLHSRRYFRASSQPISVRVNTPVFILALTSVTQSGIKRSILSGPMLVGSPVSTRGQTVPITGAPVNPRYHPTCHQRRILMSLCRYYCYTRGVLLDDETALPLLAADYLDTSIKP